MVEETVEKIQENQEQHEGDYLDEEGLHRCGICGERKENRYLLMGRERLFPCLCRCDRNRLEKQKEEDRKREFAIRVSSLKSVGLTEPRFREWRFENDNGSNPKLDIARKYVNEWEEMRKHPINFSQDITSYTAKGREKIHKSVQCVKTQELRNVMKYMNPNESIEFNDNSISAYLVQQGNCYVMGNRLNVHQMKCIRKIPVGEGGTDKHTNIAFISEEIWRAVMTEDISETIKIMKKFNMDDKQRRRFNRLRENYGLLPIKKR